MNTSPMSCWRHSRLLADVTSTWKRRGRFLQLFWGEIYFYNYFFKIKINSKICAMVKEGERVQGQKAQVNHVIWATINNPHPLEASRSTLGQSKGAKKRGKNKIKSETIVVINGRREAGAQGRRWSQGRPWPERHRPLHRLR